MLETTTVTSSIAILIDAENVPSSLADAIFDRVGQLGRIAVREMYGSGAALSAWTAPALKYAIHPNITLRQTKGKNTSDIALTIGAMDLMDSANDTIAIASSDSDFSALAVRLRTAGLRVIGIGEEKSNELWKLACSEFITMESRKDRAEEESPAPVRPRQVRSLRRLHSTKREKAAAPVTAQEAADEVKQNQPAAETAPAPAPVQEQKPARKPQSEPAEETPAAPAAPAVTPADVSDVDYAQIIRDAIDAEHSSSGWVPLSGVATALQKRINGFSTALFGFRSMSELIASIPDVEMRRTRAPGRPNQRVVSLRRRETVPAAEETAPAPEAEATEEMPELTAVPDAAAEETAPAAIPEEKVQETPAADDDAGQVTDTAAKEQTAEVPDEPAEEMGTEEPAQDGEQTADEVRPSPETAQAEAAGDDPAAAMTARLVRGGMDVETAGRISAIMNSDASMFVIYNTIRKQFGGHEGAELYRRVKEILAEKEETTDEQP